MIYILFVSIILILILAFYFNKKDLISPWFVVSFMFLIATLIAILNQNKWNTDISGITLLVIIISLICWGVGDILATTILPSKVKKYEPRNEIVICFLVLCYIFYICILNISIMLRVMEVGL